MKKIYLSLLTAVLAGGSMQAQLSLTKAVNEPVIGDIYNKQQYDSTTAIPKSTGAGQNWNFTSLTLNSYTETSTYMSPASTPSPSIFPGATISEWQGGGSYTHYKSTASTFEYQGIQFTGTVINFSNTGVSATWPVNFGYNGNDTFGGSTTSGTLTSSILGSINVSGAGTGTVVMPGGLTLTNCLQVVNTITFALTQNTVTQNQVQTEYTYYHASTKYPILSMQYQTQTTGTVTSKSINIFVNRAVVAGIKESEINNNFSVYPNPASGTVNMTLANNLNKQVDFTLTNMLGQVVKHADLGSDSFIQTSVDVAELPKGIYFIRLNGGTATSVKKIVIE